MIFPGFLYNDGKIPCSLLNSCAHQLHYLLLSCLPCVIYENNSFRELHFTRTLHVSNPSIEYYYMGFYIHSCPKMLYKGRLPGSDLLCPETYAWLPIEKCIPKLDVSKYAKLNDDPNATDNDACSAEDVDSIKVLIGYTFTTFGVYKRKYGGQELFNNIGNLCGKTCLGNLLFVIEN